MRCVCFVYVLAILRHGFGIPSGEEGKCKINQAAHNEQPDLFSVKLKGVFTPASRQNLLAAHTAVSRH